VRGLTFPLLVAASLAALVGCGTGEAREKPLSRSAAQALRVCVDRWNEAHMRDWGPARASVGRRRLDAARLAAIGLRRGPRRCVVSLAVGRSSTWSCVVVSTGAYGCPVRHEADRIPLRNENATIDRRGVLKLDHPLQGTRPARRLAWQRYPRIDGWIEPWTRSGKLLRGLRFTSTYTGGGSCPRGFPSEQTPAKSAVRCLWRGLYQVDPCFAPPGRWNHRGGVVACPNGPGATTFGRFVIGPPSYRAVDFPVLVPWTGVGAISLGEGRTQVAHDYDAAGHRFHVQARGDRILDGYYALHHSRLYVTFRDGRVNDLGWTTRFYRTSEGFGVGSRIPLGPCHRTATAPCERRWHGFVWNALVRDKPCSCWVKVGYGKRSLPATGANFLKPWTLIYVRHGRVTRFHLSRKFVD
jgi:hypothetical protein